MTSAPAWYASVDFYFYLIIAVTAGLQIAGFGRFALFGIIDSIVHLFFPGLSLKYDFRKYYPALIKNSAGETMKAFRTPRDEYYPSHGPLPERIGDFLMRFPFFSLTLFVFVVPFCTTKYASGMAALTTVLRKYIPAMPSLSGMPVAPELFPLFIVLFFLPFASLHSAQVSLQAIFLFPFAVFFKTTGKTYQFLRMTVPPVLCTLIFVFLFIAEITLIYAGFLPLFHQGIIPFLENAPGLKQFIFWVPVKFKIYLDLVLVPVVVVVPLITTIGSYILAHHDDKEGKTNYIVLFYKTAIAYLYAPLLLRLFPRMQEESAAVRKERRINEILVLGMFLESIATVAGMGYAYFSLSRTNNVPMSGVILGMLILLVFIPLIVFSSCGFQSFFLDKSVYYWGIIRAKIAALHSKGTGNE